MANSELTTTFLPPLVEHAERLYYGIDGEKYNFNGIEDTETFDEYLEKYIRPYAEHLAWVDGVTSVRLPMSWNVWEYDYTEGNAIDGVTVNEDRLYRKRLAEILRILAETNLKVVPVLWSGHTNLSGYFYPLSILSKCEFEGIRYEAAVDRELFEWTNGLDVIVTDRDFDSLSYTYWTGSAITISSDTQTHWGQNNPSTNNVAVIDNTDATYDYIAGEAPFISPLFLNSLKLPSEVPAQFLFNVRADQDTELECIISTIGESGLSYYWTGKYWSLEDDGIIPSVLIAVNTSMRQQRGVWFETSGDSLTGNYTLKIKPADENRKIAFNKIGLYLCGSEPDIRNYFCPRNTSEDDYALPIDMIKSSNGYRGQLTINEEIVPPFESYRNAVTLPNPGSYRINNYEAFFSSTYEDVAITGLNNLDINGASYYITDILETLGNAITEHNLTVEAIDIFEYPFAINRPLFSDRESACLINFIQKTADEVKNHASYVGTPLMLSGKSPEVFSGRFCQVKDNGPTLKPFTWLKHRKHPVTHASQYGMDTGSGLAEYNVFYPDSNESSPLVTDFELGDYQSINFKSLENSNTAYNLKFWDVPDKEVISVASPSGIPYETQHHLKHNWEEGLLDDISAIGLYCGYDSSYNVSELPYPISALSSIGYANKWTNTPTIISALEVGCIEKEDYFARDVWFFREHWNAYYTNEGSTATEGFYVNPVSSFTNQEYIPIHIGDPLKKGYIIYDTNRKLFAYNTEKIDDVLIEKSYEYLNFIEYNLVAGGARVYPSHISLPLQFEANKTFIFGGIPLDTTAFDNDPSTSLVKRSIANIQGNTLDLVWSPKDVKTNAEYAIDNTDTVITVFSFDAVEGSLGLLTKDSSFEVTLKEGEIRILKRESKEALQQRVEGDWDHMWAMLPDFWTTHFEDLPAISEMWGGLADVASNMLSNLYQYDLAKSIQLAPPEIIASNETLPITDASYLSTSSYDFFNGVDTSAQFMIADSVKSIPLLQKKVNEEGDIFKENEDYEIKDGKLYFKDNVISTSSTSVLFAPWISYDESIIYQNFGVFLDFKKPESMQYKEAVMAGLYGLWNGHTLNVFKLICDAIAGFPLIPYRGRVKFINNTNTLLSLIIEDQFGNERTIEIPAVFAPSTERPIIVRTGLTSQVTVTNAKELMNLNLFSLAPASNAFDVYDRKTKPEKIESLAKVLRKQRIGLYNTTIGELDANSIDKVGELYEKLGWGSRNEMYDDLFHIIEQVRGQYHLFQFLIAQRPIEEALIKEKKPDMAVTLHVEPTFDHNMYNYMHSGSDWVLKERQESALHVAPNLEITKEGAERNKFNPNEARTQGQTYKKINTDELIEDKDTVYASLGGKGLEDGSKSGWTLGFDRIKAAAGRVFKFFPSFNKASQDIHASGWGNFIYDIPEQRNIGIEPMTTWESDRSGLSLFNHYGTSGNGEWYASLHRKTSDFITGFEQHFEYPQKDDDVMPLQIRTKLGSDAEGTTVSISEGLTVLTRVRPRHKGILFELSGEIGYETEPTIYTGACCIPIGGAVCAPCSPPIGGDHIGITGCDENGYTCVDTPPFIYFNGPKNWCAAQNGSFLGNGSIAANNTSCDVTTAKCCGDDRVNFNHSGKHCNQPYGHCSDPHPCNEWYQEYCECRTGVFIANEDCFPAHNCVSPVAPGPCCGEVEEEEEEQPPKVGNTPDHINEGGGVDANETISVYWTDEQGTEISSGAFTVGKTYTLAIQYELIDEGVALPEQGISGFIALDSLFNLNLPDTEAGQPGVSFTFNNVGDLSATPLTFTPQTGLSSYVNTITLVDSDGVKINSEVLTYNEIPINLNITLNSADITPSVDNISLGSLIEGGDIESTVFTVDNTGTAQGSFTIDDSALSAFTLVAYGGETTLDESGGLNSSATYTIEFDPFTKEGPYSEVLTINAEGDTPVSHIYLSANVSASNYVLIINGGNDLIVDVEENTTTDFPFNIQNSNTSDGVVSFTFDIRNFENPFGHYGESELMLYQGATPWDHTVSQALAIGETLSLTLKAVFGEITANSTFSLRLAATTTNGDLGDLGTQLIQTSVQDITPQLSLRTNSSAYYADLNETREIWESFEITNEGLFDATVTLEAEPPGRPAWAADWHDVNQVILTDTYTLLPGETIYCVGKFTPADDPNLSTIGDQQIYNVSILSDTNLADFTVAWGGEVTTDPRAILNISPSAIDRYTFIGLGNEYFRQNIVGDNTFSYATDDITFDNDSIGDAGNIDVYGDISIVDTQNELTLNGSAAISLADENISDTRTFTFVPINNYSVDTLPTSLFEIINVGTGHLTADGPFISPDNVPFLINPVWGPVLSIHSPDLNTFTVAETDPPTKSAAHKKDTAKRVIQDTFNLGTIASNAGTVDKTFSIINTGGGALSGTVTLDSSAQNLTILSGGAFTDLENGASAHDVTIRLTVPAENTTLLEGVNITCTTGEEGYKRGVVTIQATIEPLVESLIWEKYPSFGGTREEPESVITTTNTLRNIGNVDIAYNITIGQNSLDFGVAASSPISGTLIPDATQVIDFEGLAPANDTEASVNYTAEVDHGFNAEGKHITTFTTLVKPAGYSFTITNVPSIGNAGAARLGYTFPNIQTGTLINTGQKTIWAHLDSYDPESHNVAVSPSAADYLPNGHVEVVVGASLVFTTDYIPKHIPIGDARSRVHASLYTQDNSNLLNSAQHTYVAGGRIITDFPKLVLKNEGSYYAENTPDPDAFNIFNVEPGWTYSQDPIDPNYRIILLKNNPIEWAIANTIKFTAIDIHNNVNNEAVWFLSSTEISDTYYTKTALHTEPWYSGEPSYDLPVSYSMIRPKIDATATGIQWFYLEDTNAALLNTDLRHINFHRPGIYRLRTGNNTGPGDMAKEAFRLHDIFDALVHNFDINNPSTHLHHYTGTVVIKRREIGGPSEYRITGRLVDAAGTVKDPVCDGGTYYIPIKMKNTGAAYPLRIVDNRYNVEVYGSTAATSFYPCIITELPNTPTERFTVTAINTATPIAVDGTYIVPAGTSLDMVMEITAPLNDATNFRQGWYPTVIIFSNEADPVTIDLYFHNEPAAPEPPAWAQDGDDNYCNCCIGKGTPYVYCDDTITEADCYAVGGSPYSFECEANGSMGSLPYEEEEGYK
jgi:hypothetical protein